MILKYTVTYTKLYNELYKRLQKQLCLPFCRTHVPLGLVKADFSVLTPFSLEEKSTVRMPLCPFLWMSDVGPVLSRDVVALLIEEEIVYRAK